MYWNVCLDCLQEFLCLAKLLGAFNKEIGKDCALWNQMAGIPDLLPREAKKGLRRGLSEDSLPLPLSILSSQMFTEWFTLTLGAFWLALWQHSCIRMLVSESTPMKHLGWTRTPNLHSFTQPRGHSRLSVGGAKWVPC